jgi:CubicO group peptidase (beta-lactamase class C family)
MKRLNLTTLFLMIMIYCTLAQNGKNINYTTLINEYKELLKTEMPKNKIVGLSIALVDKNGIIWAEGFGYENLKDSVKATENTLYCIGSITKLFTSTALLQLAENKKLDIDKPVTKYVPELKMKSLNGNIDSITTRLILTHHSGFPSDMLGVNSDKESYKNVVEYLNEQYTAFPPNYLRIYSNIGYCFLGYELEKVSKSNYADYISKNIFLPLGMKNSFVASETTSLKNVSRTYNSQNEQKDETYPWVVPAGGIFSNAKDMGLFIQSWLQDKSPLLKTETINSVFTPQNTNVAFNLGSEYGITWELKKSKYNYRAEHGGSTLNFRAQIAINRYAGLGVIILANSANAGSFTWRASEILDKACDIKGVVVNELPGFDIEKVIQKKINLSEFQGNYGQNMSWFPLIAKDSTLIGKPGNDSLDFKLQTSGYFGLAVKQGEKWNAIPGQKFIFTKLNGENVFMASAWGNWVVAAKQYPTQTITEAWKKRLGKYKVLNYNGSSMFSEGELAIGENTLFLAGKTPFSDQPMAMPFDIKSENLASVLGTSTYSGSMLQVKNKNGIETLYFMGLEMQKID